MASNDLFKLANKHAEEMNRAFPHAVAARYDQASGRVVVDLSSKLTLSFSPKDAQGLENARPSQLRAIEISPSGLGLHFPKLDADLYIPGLLEGLMGSRKWMAARLGAIGGEARTAAKKRAARANGLKGGRPRRSVAASSD